MQPWIVAKGRELGVPSASAFSLEVEVMRLSVAQAKAVVGGRRQRRHTRRLATENGAYRCDGSKQLQRPWQHERFRTWGGGKALAAEIENENLHILSRMQPHEIREAREEILQRFGAERFAALQRRALRRARAKCSGEHQEQNGNAEATRAQQLDGPHGAKGSSSRMRTLRACPRSRARTELRKVRRAFKRAAQLPPLLRCRPRPRVHRLHSHLFLLCREAGSAFSSGASSRVGRWQLRRPGRRLRKRNDLGPAFQGSCETAVGKSAWPGRCEGWTS
ncbi:hypothetical protein BESB_051170 [Besnoitia besnoiti]|uniref:RPAP1 N-terminal domain-containing protein n=1 Tax=Besnoitia besnoiti TaxID=94643 RepID=A0A2A9M5Q7_BESBE|nr:uncharacterized protein BESB_051170 [Besnoitia besnoiti]PFH30977.1 hypothetical protein BESB_051170 [Besnoitia besnoiti]